MKFKMIMAACAAVCSTGAFAAATPVTCAPGTLAGLVNTCAPEVTFYVGGASAQAGALNALLASGGGIFDTSAIRGKLTDTAVTTSGAGNTVGYIGLGATGTPYAGKRVLVIYNKANGSAAGVLQLLTGKGTAAKEEVTLITAGAKALSKGTAGTCSVTEPATAGALGTGTCLTEAAFSTAWGADAQKKMHLALSDVRPSELSPGIVKKWDAVAYPATTLTMQGFGVIVNPALYTALITKEIAAGRLPASCATSETVGGALGTDVITAACQPNISRADYASIITGNITTADALLGTTGNTKTITLARRVDSSGTQASSNIFFAGQAGFATKTPATDGFATILGAGTVGGLTVTASSATGDVINAVSGDTTNYSLGVVSLENTYSMAASSKLKGALFVKIDGISPNFKADGSLDSKHRAGLQAGYPFAFEAVAVKPTALAGNYKDIADKIVAGLMDPAVDLPGQAYIGSADAAKNTSFTHHGINYLPLTK
jgi:hypothetical protein